ncbi:putative F-box protein At4g10190 [Papaver somniferum]|uniref:putative F-box protein At4g10190 n=1 Tax=Papaver somniferum TaxID=3469 RepID=UPI000E70488A|nr:putative F-box protein At4g10190 [Papaver somniferum]
MEYFKKLPADITVDILSRVPTETVLECKSICKTWNNLVSNHPSFSKMHLYHLNQAAVDSGKLGFLALTYEIGKSIPKFSYFEIHQSTTPIEKITRMNLTPPFTGAINFLGSYNGLVCFTRCRSLVEQLKGDGIVCICNPITKEYVMLPEINRDCCDTTDQFVSRKTVFGFVSSTNEYKVMRMLLMPEFVEVYIYTLGSGIGWRNIGRFNVGLSPHAPGIFANGVVYLIGTQLGVILTFDLSEEIFCENLSPPLPVYNDSWAYNKIGVLDGFLFYASLLVSQRDYCHDIWLLRKRNVNHDMKEQEECQSWAWNKEFKVDNRELLALTKNDSVLTYKNFKLSVYDTKASTSETLVEFKDRFRKIHPHKNTLVSLKELGEEDTKIMEPVEGDRKP